MKKAKVMEEQHGVLLFKNREEKEYQRLLLLYLSGDY